MITENGIVTEANPFYARIRTIRSVDCESCSSKENCGTPQSSRKEMIVTVKNSLGVRPGDHVVIGIKAGPLMFVSFLLYIFPVLFLITGAFIGDSVAPSIHVNPTLAALVTGTLFFCAAFFIIRKKSRALSIQDSYKPFLVRKKKPPFSVVCPIS